MLKSTQGYISRPGSWSFPDCMELGVPGGGSLTWQVWVHGMPPPGKGPRWNDSYFPLTLMENFFDFAGVAERAGAIRCHLLSIVSVVDSGFSSSNFLF